MRGRVVWFVCLGALLVALSACTSDDAGPVNDDAVPGSVDEVDEAALGATEVVDQAAVEFRVDAPGARAGTTAVVALTTAGLVVVGISTAGPWVHVDGDRPLVVPVSVHGQADPTTVWREELGLLVCAAADATQTDGFEAHCEAPEPVTVAVDVPVLAPLLVSELAATAADEVALAAPAATRVVQDDRDGTVFATGEVVVVVAEGADPAVVLGSVGEVSGVSGVYGADLEFGIYQLDAISESAVSLQQLDGVATAMPMLASMADQDLPAPLDAAGMTLPVDGEELTDAQRDQWHWAMLDMQAAWELTPGSTDVTIAVVEQGVDRTHDALRDVLVPGAGPTLNRSFRDVEDRQLRHGTGVASLACSGGGTGGLVGTMQACSLLAVETELITAMAAPDDGALTEYLLYWDLAWYRGLLAAVESGAHVINLSAGAGLVRPESGLAGVLGRTEPAPGCEGERPDDLLLRRAEMRGLFDELDRRNLSSLVRQGLRTTTGSGAVSRWGRGRAG